MKFNVSLNGVTLQKEIPDSWSQVTFRMYLKIMGIPTDKVVKILSALIDIDEDTLNKSRIVGLDAVLKCLSFIRTTPMDFTVHKAILGYRIPKDLNWETTGQFKECQAIANSLKPEGETLSVEDQAKYTQIVAIYCMPNYLDATVAEQEAFAEKFYEAPCEEVLAIGNFTLLKLIGLNLNTKSGPQSKIGVLKKLRLAFKVWRLNTAFSIRYWRLQRQLTSAKMKSYTGQ